MPATPTRMNARHRPVRILAAVLLAVIVGLPPVVEPSPARAADPQPAPGNQELPAVAFNGSVFLVVWQDQRDPFGGGDIYAARVSATGAVLDPNGIPIAASPKLEWMPTVASDGNGFLVAWSQFTQPTCEPEQPCPDPTDYGDIVGRRVSGTGTVLDATPIAIDTGPEVSEFPRATHGGGGYLVAWEGGTTVHPTTDKDIRAAIVSSAGTVTRSSWRVVERPGNQYVGDTAGSPTRFAVGWNELSGVYEPYVSVLESDGDAVGSPVQLSNAPVHEHGPSVGWDGTTFVASWNSRVGETTSTSWVRRITTGGSSLDGAGLAVYANEGYCDEASPADVVDLPDRVVLYYTRNRLDCVGLEGTGHWTATLKDGVVGPSTQLPQSGWTVSDFAFGGGNVLWVVDAQQPDLSRDIFARRVSLAGAFVDPAWILVSSVTSGGTTPPPPPPPAGDTTAPTVGVPTQSILTGRRLGTSTVPLSIRWSATDAVGVTAAQLQVSRNGGAYAAVEVGSTTGAVRGLSAGSSYRFRVRARDAAGNWSAWRYGATFELRRVQETSTAITWRGRWSRKALSGASGGYVRASSTASSSSRFTFTGRQVAWVGTKGPTRGRASVYVNGKFVTSVDLWAPTTSTRTVLFSRRWTTLARRTLTIVVRPLASRSRVDVDAFVVIR